MIFYLKFICFLYLNWIILVFMKICHLTCVFPPYKGGMGNVAFEQAKRLSDLGHRVAVFVLNKKEKLDSPELNFKIKYLKAFPRFGHGGFCPQLLWSLKNYDAVVLHYPFFGAQEILWLAKKLRIVKAGLIIQYHMDAGFDNPLVKLLSLPAGIIRSNLFKIADKIVCASLDYVKHSQIKNIYRKHQSKFVEIPFGSNMDPAQIDPIKLADLKKKLDIQSEEKIVLFVGALDAAHYFKGVDILINAFNELNSLNSCRLIIVGDGDLRAKYERQAEKLNLSDKIIFAGRVSDEALPYYYALCALFVLPSTTSAEAFGLVLADALKFGKPVIGSDRPGVRDVVGEAGLLAKPADANDLAEKMKFIFEHPTDSEKIRRQAEKYDWNVHIERLKSLFSF